MIALADKYVIAHDVGTSSVKSILVNQKGEILVTAKSEYDFHYPHPGWVEQNPEDYWQGIVKNTRQLMTLSEIDGNLVLGMVFSTQAMGIIALDENDQLLNNNITWVDGRAEDQARQLMNMLGGKTIFSKLIGVEITGKDVIPKLRWIKQNLPDVYQQTKTIVDVNGYLKFRATGKKVFEWSGACSYGFDIKKKDWERLLFKAAGIDLKKFPPLVKSTDRVGTLLPEVATQMGLPETVGVYGGCDDTQSAAIGSGANGEGEAHIYLGTSAWAGVITSCNLKHKNGAAVLQSADPEKNICVGITESAGSNFDWMIEKFYHYEKNDPRVTDIYSFIDGETKGIPPGSDNLIFTPWLLGERCPVSTTTTRGTVFNLGLEHSRGHLVNAMLEGVGFNLRWIFENFKRDFGFQPSKIRAIGGGSVNEGWMQGIANITGLEVETVDNPTMAGALGVATCVFVAEGILDSFSEVKAFIKQKATFQPDLEQKELYEKLFCSYKAIYKGLKKAYAQANLERFNTTN
ncbi:MAG: FGGY-family carbohydrate kinase [Carboxylicivirga sp.]|nr:FGGY-family carbohydrate kinase [Carboxylicivirga sp.]